MGATMTVRRCWFSSSGEMTRHGRVFRIPDTRVRYARRDRVGKAGERWVLQEPFGALLVCLGGVERRLGLGHDRRERGVVLASFGETRLEPTQRLP